MDAFVRLSVSMCCTDVYTTVLAELFLTFSNATNVSSFIKPKMYIKGGVLALDDNCHCHG